MDAGIRTGGRGGTSIRNEIGSEWEDVQNTDEANGGVRGHDVLQ